MVFTEFRWYFKNQLNSAVFFKEPTEFRKHHQRIANLAYYI